MQVFAIAVVNSTGLHARPAALVVQTAKTFSSDIVIRKNDKSANAKSILSVLSLGAGPGTEIQFVIEGPDEEQAARQLKSLALEQLGSEIPCT